MWLCTRIAGPGAMAEPRHAVRLLIRVLPLGHTSAAVITDPAAEFVLSWAERSDCGPEPVSAVFCAEAVAEAVPCGRTVPRPLPPHPLLEASERRHPGKLSMTCSFSSPPWAGDQLQSHAAGVAVRLLLLVSGTALDDAVGCPASYRSEHNQHESQRSVSTASFQGIGRTAILPTRACYETLCTCWSLWTGLISHAPSAE